MPHHIVHAIKPHETFAGILKKEGLSPQQTAAWIGAAQQRAEVRRLQVGRTITFSYEPDHNGTPTLRTVSCSINQDTSLVFEKDESGHIQFTNRDHPYNPCLACRWLAALPTVWVGQPEK